MSEERVKRRRFIADLLFAGGGVAAAALIARWATAAPQQNDQPRPRGDVAPPRNASATPSSTSTPTRPQQPAVGGKPMAPTTPTPEPLVEGKMMVPHSPAPEGPR